MESWRKCSFRKGSYSTFFKGSNIHKLNKGIVTFTRDPWKHKKTISIHVIEQEIPNRTVIINLT